MAENKKSFVLYADQRNVFNSLSDKEAGLLIKHIYAYVNDLNPETTNKIVNVAFEPIKQQLKRDLKKYEHKQEKWSEAGKRSAEVKKNKKINESQQSLTNVENVTTKSTVNVNDNATVNVNDNVIHSIERCAEIALADSRWKKANKVQDGELQAFNHYLEQQGKYELNPLDYKTYFAKLKGRWPQVVSPAAKELTVEELRQMAKEMDKNSKS